MVFFAAHEFDARRRMISKNFHHVLRLSERQTLPGPPESMREHVVAASKSMKKGNSLSAPVSSTNKTDCHDITGILLKVALNTINQTKPNHTINFNLFIP
jgi:hypothetical protein